MVDSLKNLASPSPAGFGFKAWRGRLGQMNQPHRHHDVEVNLIVDGWVEYLLGGTRVRLEAGRLYLFWAAIPHYIIERHGTAAGGWLLLPVPWAWQWGAGAAVMGPLLAGQMLTEKVPEPGDGDAITRWSAMLQRNDARWRHIVELEAEARMRRLFIQGAEVVSTDRSAIASPNSAQGRGDAHHRVEAMAAYLAANCTQPVEIVDVAEAVSLHPNYAMRLFRRHTGMTLIDYLTRQRLAVAQRLLITTCDTVLSIAMSSGFGSVSRFHDAFRKHTGTSPGQFRRANQTAADV